MRILGVDLGRRRIGLAVSDDTGMLARPWQTIGAGATPSQSVEAIAQALAADPSMEVGRIVVGLPKRLNGDDNDETPGARAIADGLSVRTGLAVELQDERLTSREAEARLAVNERDWRRRKQKLDAAAAAIILQDYLDAHDRARSAADGEGRPEC